MTTLPAPTDALAESQRLIAAIEQLRGELPFADDILAVHRPTHQELEISCPHQSQRIIQCIFNNSLFGFRTVGNPSGISEINH